MIPAIYYDDMVLMRLQRFIQTRNSDFSAIDFSLLFQRQQPIFILISVRFNVRTPTARFGDYMQLLTSSVCRGK